MGDEKRLVGKTLESVLGSTAKIPPWRVLRLTLALLDASPAGADASTDARSDAYSAGCLMYELLTGRSPFLADSAGSLVDQQPLDPPLPPSELNPDVSGEIDAIALRALAKDAADRYGSAREMSADIRNLLARTALGLRVEGSHRPGHFRTAPSVRSAVRQSVRVLPSPSAGQRSSPRRVVLVVAGIAVLLSPLGILDLRDSPQPGVSAVGADLPRATKPGSESLLSRTWLDPNVDTFVVGRGGAQDASARTPGATPCADAQATGSSRLGTRRAAASTKSGSRTRPGTSVKVVTPKLTVNPVKVSTPKLTVNPVKISTPKLTVNPVKVSTPKLTVNPVKISTPKLTVDSTTATTKAAAASAGSTLQSTLGSVLGSH